MRTRLLIAAIVGILIADLGTVIVRCDRPAATHAGSVVQQATFYPPPIQDIPTARQIDPLVLVQAAVQYQEIPQPVIVPPAPPVEPKVEPTKAPVVTSGDEVWDKLAQCESGGNWADTAGQFEGGIQFLNSTWLAYGGAEFAQHAYDATREEQIIVGKRQLAGRPDWSAWPACSRKLGLR